MQNGENHLFPTDNNRKNLRKTQIKKQLSEYLHICQCGRQFLSFPAIYSHAKTKHNMRISSRIGDSHRKLYIQNNQNKIYYQILNIDHQQYDNVQQNSDSVPLKVNPKQSSSKFNFLNKIKKFQTATGERNIYSATVEFLNYCTKKISRKDFQAINDVSQTLDGLTKCINEHYMHYDPKKIYSDYCLENTPESIPLYFNFYIIWYLPSHNAEFSNEKKSKSCTLLRIFFKWLVDHKLTLLEYLKQQNIDQDHKSLEEKFFKIPDQVSNLKKEQQNLSNEYDNIIQKPVYKSVFGYEFNQII